jgi:hypothetical protein
MKKKCHLFCFVNFLGFLGSPSAVVRISVGSISELLGGRIGGLGA